jgi:hypothetical protein
MMLRTKISANNMSQTEASTRGKVGENPSTILLSHPIRMKTTMLVSNLIELMALGINSWRSGLKTMYSTPKELPREIKIKPTWVKS